MLCVHLHLILVWKMRNVNFALLIRDWKLFGTVSKQMNKEKGKRRPMNLFFIFVTFDRTHFVFWSRGFYDFPRVLIAV